MLWQNWSGYGQKRCELASPTVGMVGGEIFKIFQQLVTGKDVPWLSVAFFLWMSSFEDLVNMLVLEERVPCGCRLAHD